ncbi:MAG TPA: multidrug efflux SMR transporter [Actinomycetes bacterium]|nr:multidrug efflux SMR transporter [Actinomycetes bacterium]
MPTWLLLASAILFEVTGTVFLRVSDGFTKFWPSLVVVIGYGASFYLLALIMKTGIPQGIVYAIWSAFGIALVTLIGMAAFNDKITPITGVGLVIVIVGVVLVQLGNTDAELG